jgi:hypothetical protein
MVYVIMILEVLEPEDDTGTQVQVTHNEFHILRYRAVNIERCRVSDIVNQQQRSMKGECGKGLGEM